MNAKEPCALDDLVMRERFRQIIAEYKIKVVVETGIHKGWSTIELAKMCETVIGIDNNLTFIAEAYGNIHDSRITNASIIVGNSPPALWALRHLLPTETLYFLDAHWQSYWPLRDEISMIRVGKGVIVLHDVQIPNHPELGFDAYDGKTLNYEYVKDALTKWSPAHHIEFNSRSEGTQHPRGVMYVYPE